MGVRYGYVRAGRGNSTALCRTDVVEICERTATGLELPNIQSTQATIGAQMATQVKTEVESSLPRTLGTGLNGGKQLRFWDQEEADGCQRSSTNFPGNRSMAF